MPELPEVRALAERLDEQLRGLELARVDVPGFSGLKTVQPSPADLVGATLEHVGSRGKFLVFDFRQRGRALIHLGNSGRLDVEQPPKSTRPRGSLTRLGFDSFSVLVREHGSERRAGLWILADGDEGPLAALGPEPFDAAFEDLLRTGDDRRNLHTLLRDQHTVAGIGRGYADDILHHAALSPFASLNGLSGPGRERLLASVRAVLEDALTRERLREGGLSDASLGDRFAVHRRAGAACPRCEQRLERVSYATHEVVYCPRCQTGGRLLADRRLSRLLR